MNKSQLIEKLAAELEIDVNTSKRCTDLFFQKIKAALNNGDKVEIRGFGSWQMKDYGGYTGRNPKTGESVDVSAKKLPIFKTGKDLKKRVNSSSYAQKFKGKFN